MMVLTGKQKIEKAARTTQAALDAITEERRQSEKKTARLKALRLARDAQAPVGEQPVLKPRRKSR